jgi:mannose-1-phosphate guanylyltransferase
LLSTTYFVILAGGRGERLWPLSRKKRPKQLLPFIRKKTLLQQAVERTVLLAPVERRWVVTTQEQEEAVKNVVGSTVGQIVIEPYARNTAAAMMLAAREVQAVDPDAVIVFLSSDHYIPDLNIFGEFINHAVDFAAQHEKITLLGLTPTYPSTGYGYISYQRQQSYPAKVTGFYEKPDLKTAEDYLKKDFLWNSGMVIAQAKVFLEECQKHALPILEGVDRSLAGEPCYKTIESISIDYAVMEKSENLVVLPANFVWCDVGNLESFLLLKQSAALDNNIINIDAHNNLVDVQDGIVALVGVKDLCVIQNDHVLLIVDRQQSEKVKLVLDKLKKDHRDYL